MLRTLVGYSEDQIVEAATLDCTYEPCVFGRGELPARKTQREPLMQMVRELSERAEEAPSDMERLEWQFIGDGSDNEWSPWKKNTGIFVADKGGSLVGFALFTSRPCFRGTHTHHLRAFVVQKGMEEVSHGLMDAARNACLEVEKDDEEDRLAKLGERYDNVDAACIQAAMEFVMDGDLAHHLAVDTSYFDEVSHELGKPNPVLSMDMLVDMAAEHAKRADDVEEEEEEEDVGTSTPKRDRDPCDDPSDEPSGAKRMRREEAEAEPDPKVPPKLVPCSDMETDGECERPASEDDEESDKDKYARLEPLAMAGCPNALFEIVDVILKFDLGLGFPRKLLFQAAKAGHSEAVDLCKKGPKAFVEHAAALGNSKAQAILSKEERE